MPKPYNQPSSNQNDSPLFPQNIIDQILVKFLLNLPMQQRKSKSRLPYHYQKAYYYYMDEVLKQKPDEDYNKADKYRIKFLQKLNDSYKIISMNSQKSKENKQKAVHLEISDILKVLGKQKPTCGAIILAAGDSKVLVIESGGKLGFPKGGKNQRQTCEACAARQVKQQVGLFIHNHIDSTDKVQFLSMGEMPAVYYVVRDFDMNQPLKLDKNQIDDAYWMNVSQVSKLAWKLTGKSRIAWKIFEEQLVVRPRITMEDFLKTYKNKQNNQQKNQNQISQNPLLNFKFNKDRLFDTLK